MNLLDLGHGGVEPNTGQTGAMANGLMESAIVTDIGIMAAAGLRALGHPVGLTRTDNTPLSVVNRKQLITSPVLSTVVSIHANYASSVDARGWEIFVSAFNEDSKLLGNMVAKELMTYAAIPPRKEAVKTKLRSATEDFYYVVNEPTKMSIPAILVEVGFVSNKLDADVLRLFWSRFSIAHRIARGIDAYIQLKEG